MKTRRYEPAEVKNLKNVDWNRCYSDLQSKTGVLPDLKLVAEFLNERGISAFVELKNQPPRFNLLIQLCDDENGDFARDLKVYELFESQVAQMVAEIGERHGLIATKKQHQGEDGLRPVYNRFIFNLKPDYSLYRIDKTKGSKFVHDCDAKIDGFLRYLEERRLSRDMSERGLPYLRPDNKLPFNNGSVPARFWICRNGNFTWNKYWQPMYMWERFEEQIYLKK